MAFTLRNVNLRSCIHRNVKFAPTLRNQASMEPALHKDADGGLGLGGGRFMAQRKASYTCVLLILFILRLTSTATNQNQVLHMTVPVIDFRTGKEVIITVSY